MNARVYVWVCKYDCVCIYIYMCACVSVYVCMLVCGCMCLRVCVCVCVFMCVCVLARLYPPWCILHIDQSGPLPPTPLRLSLRRRGGPAPETKEGCADGDCVMARQRHLEMDRG